jgi:hypothetical protein
LVVTSLLEVLLHLLETGRALLSWGDLLQGSSGRRRRACATRPQLSVRASFDHDGLSTPFGEVLGRTDKLELLFVDVAENVLDLEPHDAGRVALEAELLGGFRAETLVVPLT